MGGLAAFHARHAADPEDFIESTDDEDEAGLAELGDRFGQTLTADALATSFGISWAAVYALDADTVFRKLRLEQGKAAYARRLSAIQRDKHK